MSRLSRKKVHIDVQKELEEQLASIIASLYDQKEIGIFLNEFFTQEEKIMLGKRLVLYMLLAKGIYSEDIHATLGVTYDTIRLYKLQLATKPEPFRKSINKLVQKKKTKELWKKIDKILTPLELAIQARSNMKARAKIAQGAWFDKK
jgi:uncharacterized protein YerC